MLIQRGFLDWSELANGMETASGICYCLGYGNFYNLGNYVPVNNINIETILRIWEIGIRGSGDPFFLSPSPSIPSTPPPPLRGA